MVFIHKLADVAINAKIGNGTKIWQFVVVCDNVIIGENCNICCHCFIENDVIIGDNCTIKSGVQLWKGVNIGCNTFVGPNVAFCNDKYPISRNENFDLLNTSIGQGVSIGANSTILPGISIGDNVIIGAGSLVTKDIPSNSLVYNNEYAKVQKYL